ncbi:MAG: hypothetical protein MUC69_10095 [Gemmatimonadales bacterium]|nr:hypothetical protein [Gemmatimonadales bacterium]
MAEHDETYDDARARRLEGLLRELARRILALDGEGRLLAETAELQRLLGDARSELFHYEVRCTYDTPEVAESRRIVSEAEREPFTPDDPEDDEPWRPRRPLD